MAKSQSCFYQVCRLLLSKSCCLPFITVLCLLSLLLSSLQMESSLKLDLRTRFDKISPWTSFHIEKSSNNENALQAEQVGFPQVESQKQGENPHGPAVEYLRAPPSNVLKDRAKNMMKKKRERKRDKVKVEDEKNNLEFKSVDSTETWQVDEVVSNGKDNSSVHVANVSGKIEALKLKLAKNPIGKKKWSPKERKESPKAIKIKTNLNPIALKESVNKELALDGRKERQALVNKFRRYHKTHMNNPSYAKYYSEEIEVLPKQKRGIFLQTNYRSGSTFLGQLFNQHPNAFYTFEPLYPWTDCSSQIDERLKVIKGALQCDFVPAVDVYGSLISEPRKQSPDIKCLTDNFCFRSKTKDLCSKEFCPSGRRSGQCERCGPLHLPRLNHFCRQHDVAVTKVIRLCDLTSMKSIMEDPSMDVKIIHLIRDPRGMINSRFKINKIWPVPNTDSTCTRIIHNAKFAKDSGAEWLKGRYLIIRYEDLALHPMETAEKIYKFADMPFLPEVKKWITDNTRSSSGKNPYSTNRNSAETMERWRKDLSFEQVKQVQKVCSDALNYFGYKIVKSETELHNFNKTLVL